MISELFRRTTCRRPSFLTSFRSAWVVLRKPIDTRHGNFLILRHTPSTNTNGTDQIAALVKRDSATKNDQPSIGLLDPYTNSSEKQRRRRK